MTCIVGLVHKKKVYMGGDSAGVGGLDLDVRADPKVFQNGPFLMGYTSSFRMGQLLRFQFKPPVQKIKDVEEYMVTKFIPVVLTLFEKHWWVTNKEQDERKGGQFLVGYKGRLFKIYGDFQVAWNHKPFDACGCGADYAKGAMDVLHGIDLLTPEEKVTKALESAESFSGGVRGPFMIMKQ